MGYQEYLESSDSESSKAWALIELASWCCVSEGNLSNTNSGKSADVQYFHRMRVGVELPVTAPVVQCTPKGIARSHVAAGPPTVFLCWYASHGEIYHLFVGPGGEGFVAGFISELFPVGTVGRDVRRRFRGGALRALPDARWRRVLRRRYAVGIHAMAPGRQGRRAF